MPPPPPISTLFPYTTLFRSNSQFAVCERNLQTIHVAVMTFATDNNERFPSLARAETSDAVLAQLVPKYTSQTASFICPASHDARSEEHTSEVQSQSNLVCRL